MKSLLAYSYFLLLWLFVWTQQPLQAQISHGGSPLFYLPGTEGTLRSALNDESFFITLPSFNVDSLLTEDALNQGNMRGALRFAHTFFQQIDSDVDGHRFTLADGSRVWQVGIRSSGAYSINVLFSQFLLPKGGRLFLYSADRSHVLGSFTQENNPEGGVFPVSPVYGDEIIVEYVEPADVPFHGKLVVSEINHDYRGVLRVEPYNNNSGSYNCMPDILCSEGKDDPVTQSVVLLIVNGNTLCSGSMINNTAQDGTPYLLTAMHCFNNSKPVHFPYDHYVDKAGTVVAFFNYNRPVCDSQMRGMEEMSVAGAYARCIIEPLDVALLELKQSPPSYYQAYLAGWNLNPQIDQETHLVTNIHHPFGDLKKYGQSTEKIATTSFNEVPLFQKNAFWEVPKWTVGSTHGGSSGSPLFDENGLILGALSGGSSACINDTPNGESDLFSKLTLAWTSSIDSLRLDKWLDKTASGNTTCEGMSLSQTSLFRLANANYNQDDELVTTTVTSPSDYLFGGNSRNILEYAEEFSVDQATRVYGAYLLTPPISGMAPLNIHLYESNGSVPGNKITTVPFYPSYTNYSGGSFSEPAKKLSQAAESFVLFPDTPLVGTLFFIGYELPTASSPFLVYNTLFHSGGYTTAWIKDPISGWQKSSKYLLKPTVTSLAIQPLLADSSSMGTQEPNLPGNLFTYQRTSKLLHVHLAANQTARVRLYHCSGRLLQEYSVQGEVLLSLPSIYHNSVGIIELISPTQHQKTKVVF